jgi:hypothetical protein
MPLNKLNTFIISPSFCLSALCIHQGLLPAPIKVAALQAGKVAAFILSAVDLLPPLRLSNFYLRSGVKLTFRIEPAAMLPLYKVLD